MKRITIYKLELLILSFLILLIACQTYKFRANYVDANKLIHENKNLRTKPFLKAHLLNGDVCILKDSWQIDTINNVLNGIGVRYDFNRTASTSGDLIIPIDSVAIFETNKKILNPEAGRIAALAILTALNFAVGIICITDPKACYGSCPTFYINENNNFHYADAEGFSNAISRSLEYADIDALNHHIHAGETFSITMKNEALETHCVENVKLLACSKGNNNSVYHSNKDEFFECSNIYPISNASGPEGNITDLLKYEDRNERFSLSNEKNLSHKEELILEFENDKYEKELGLIINFRQTLMTTYFIYSALGFMGDQVSDVFARLETDSTLRNKLNNGLLSELGKIDVYTWNDKINNWEYCNSAKETGPIAFNKQIIPLTFKNHTLKIKMKIILNSGLWRIDYLALTKIIKKAMPIEVEAGSILNKGKLDSDALVAINQKNKYLISMPGSEYKFNFLLPGNTQEYELFLYSKGYYLEWMRDHWLKDKDLFMLNKMVSNPKQYLKDEAKEYKKYEITMEEQFWNSRIDTKGFSYYEN